MSDLPTYVLERVFDAPRKAPPVSLNPLKSQRQRNEAGMQTKLLSVLAILSLLVTGAVLADEFKPAVVYDIGGKFDKSFNESVWNGVRKFTGETGIEVKEFQITNETQREQAMRGLVERGATMVIAVGFAQADAIDAVAGEYPDRQFAIIDVSWLDRPNLRQYVFKEHEGELPVEAVQDALPGQETGGRLSPRCGKVFPRKGFDVAKLRTVRDCHVCQTPKLVGKKEGG